MKKIHKDCGGEIINNKCEKCGKIFGKIARLVGRGIEHPTEEKLRFDPKEYRKRIRRGNDIYKGR